MDVQNKVNSKFLEALKLMQEMVQLNHKDIELLTKLVKLQQKQIKRLEKK